MPAPQYGGYIQVGEYSQLTNDVRTDVDEAIRRASRLLDQRIGYRTRRTTATAEDSGGADVGWKLGHEYDTNANVTTFPDLDPYQAEAVRRWVANMAKFILDNGGELPVDGMVKIGRFSKTVKGGDALRSAMQLADGELVESGLIQRYKTPVGAT